MVTQYRLQNINISAALYHHKQRKNGWGENCSN